MPPALLDALHQLGSDPLKPAEHWLAPDFELFAREDRSLLKPDFPRPCFEADFYCQLPWLLEMPPTEAYPMPWLVLSTLAYPADHIIHPLARLAVPCAASCNSTPAATLPAPKMQVQRKNIFS